MFEIPEYVTLARQMAESLSGKRIAIGTLGNSPHKFVWYNRKPAEFASLVKGKTVGRAHSRGRWLFIPLQPGYVLVFGACGGTILLHAVGSDLPRKHHLSLQFEDGSSLSATTRMWGAMELFEKGKELERKYVKGMRPTPIDPGFTAAHLSALIEACAVEGSRSVKGLLTQDQLIPGLGNALAQDIMFKARLHPRRPVAGLSRTQVKNLHQAIVGTVAEAMKPTCRGTPDRTGASWTVQRRGTRAQRAERKSRRWRTWEAPASTARHARKHRETHLPNVVEDRWPAERHMRST